MPALCLLPLRQVTEQGIMNLGWERESPCPGVVGGFSQWPQHLVKTCGDGGPGVTTSFMGTHSLAWPGAGLSGSGRSWVAWAGCPVPSAPA